jgi:hypothetical protein
MSNRGGEVTGSSHGHDSGNNCGPDNALHTGLNASALDAAAVSTSCWEFME